MYEAMSNDSDNLLNEGYLNVVIVILYLTFIVNIIFVK